jgi:hypothetical protein
MDKILQRIKDIREEKNPTDYQLSTFFEILKEFNRVGIAAEGYIAKKDYIPPAVKCKWCNNLKSKKVVEVKNVRVSAAQYKNKKKIVDKYYCTVYGVEIIDFDTLEWCDEVKLK